jgi:methyl-accepting chemotaxis protein
VAQAGAQSATGLHASSVDPETRLDLAGELKIISSTTSDLINVDLKTALDDNETYNDSEHRVGNHRLRALEGQFNALSVALNAYADQVHKSLLGDAPGDKAGFAAASRGQYLAGQLMDVSTALAPELSRLCRERAARYAHTRLVGLVVAILAFFGISYVFNGFYRSLTLARRRIELEHEVLQEDILGLLNVVSEASQGDLRVRAKVGEGDLGNVGDAFNQMLERWQQLIGAINQQLSRTNQAVVELRAASGRMAAGASQQAQEVMAAAVSVQRMSDQIHLVSGNAATAAEAAQRTQTSANEGNSSVRDVIVGMETLKNEVAAGAKKIKTLGDRSMEITSIVATIAKISEQTNMLALNAAIEAARAGDHGRGFSVVADEVRKLAERTAAATQEIEKLVRTILTETSNSVGAIERQSQVVEEEGRAVANAGTALTRIRSESEQSTALVSDIARIARAQAEDAVAVASTMDRISVIAGETANGANGSLDIAASLQELSAALRESVTRFKVH